MRLKPEGLDLPQQIFMRFELGTPNFNFFVGGYGEQVFRPFRAWSCMHDSEVLRIINLCGRVAQWRNRRRRLACQIPWLCGSGAVYLVPPKASQIKLCLMPSLPTNKKIRIKIRIKRRRTRTRTTRIKITGNDVTNSTVGSWCAEAFAIETIMQCYAEDRKETSTVSYGKRWDEL